MNIEKIKLGLIREFIGEYIDRIEYMEPEDIKELFLNMVMIIDCKAGMEDE